jgi:hypothetical protein
MNPATDLRVRLFVDLALVDEAWIDTSRPDADELMQKAATRQTATALGAGKPFMVEFYDPATDTYKRAGTDSRLMVDPSQPMPIDELIARVKKEQEDGLG